MFVSLSKRTYLLLTALVFSLCLVAAPAIGSNDDSTLGIRFYVG